MATCCLSFTQLLGSERGEPRFQGGLAGGLDRGEGDSHARVLAGKDHFAEGGEAGTAVRNSESDLRSFGEWIG